MKKYTKWIVLGAITVPAIGYLYYPTAATPVSVQSVNTPAPLSQAAPLPKPPMQEPPIVIQLDTNAQKLIQKSNELVQKQLDAELNKLSGQTFTPPMNYQVPDMSKTYLTEADVGDTPPVGSLLDQVQFRGVIATGTNQVAYLSIADSAPFKVRVGSTFQGITVTRITPNGIEIRKGKQTRQLSGE
ncbi:hypothetical protein E4T25_04310 [Photobacterium damselae subsp. piscicida]|uniref:hypothetical protein n=1 Tax=Photobacterium damselae TaxID=38293 RepID=UPI0010764AC7|nr:hypothetical protein [Photobacterium damselae]TFZ62425.1 hypothetical protein E4T25_04310 [Photobacterium damselae subsp. piscicida]